MKGAEGEERHNIGIYHSDILSDEKFKQEEKEEKMDNKGIIVATPFEIMDRLDDEQIIDSMKGKVIDTLVYSYSDSSGKKVEGLSKTGVDESCKQLANKGEVIRELECDLETQDETYACFKAKAGRFAVGPDGKEVLLETKIGHKRQCKYVIGKGNIPNKDKPNAFWYEQGGQKALRNCRRDLLSEQFIIELIKAWKKEGKVKEIKEANGATTSSKPQEPQGSIGETINFGKYKGKTLEEIYEVNSQYFDWLLKQDWFNEAKWSELKEKVQTFLDGKRFPDTPPEDAGEPEPEDDGVN